MPPQRPDRTLIAPGLAIARVVTGLWQVADQERGGTLLDREAAAQDMGRYAAAGFDTFDMADHYGSAEDIAGAFRASAAGRGAVCCTKWCPPPGPMSAATVRAGIERACQRLQTDCLDLLQFHWWQYEHPAWLDALGELARLRTEGRIRALGLTNFDTDHLRVAVKHGVPIATNQVCFSLLDRRAVEDMSAFCLTNGVKLLAYGTLAGGFLSERWRGAPEPSAIGDWSKMKYKRFIDTIGGWPALQAVLAAAAAVARKHGVSIANVATRWVLEQPAVAAVIVGARLTEREHRAEQLALFGFTLDSDDHAQLAAAFAQLQRIPGDCGDEYRRPPFLTAAGDLSHHLAQLPPVYRPTAIASRPGRMRIDSGSQWEPRCGYSRAVRVGERILISGTTATHGVGTVVCPSDAAGQAVYILDKIKAALHALGGSLDDVVRTRIFLTDVDDWEAVGRVHGRVFASVRPANTLMEVSRLVGDYRVEIEVEAVLG